MKKVVIESPYKATDAYSIEQHKRYLEFAMQDALRRGEAPFASHMLYTDVLDDDNAVERSQGIQAGLIWGECCDYVAVYRDMGISSGMKLGMDHWDKLGKRVEWRTIAHELFKAVLEM
jgi:hypothetical protein